MRWPPTTKRPILATRPASVCFSSGRPKHSRICPGNTAIPWRVTHLERETNLHVFAVRRAHY
jgi:hypothetical protein